MTRSADLSPAGGCPARRRFSAMWSSTCRPIARSTSRWCASAPRRGDRDRPGDAALLCRGRGAGHAPPAGDLERVYEALESNGTSQGCRPIPPSSRGCRRHCARATGRSPARCTTAFRQRIIAVWPGYHDKIYGLAVDIGSTTIAAHLSDIGTGEVLASAGVMNPQIRFGEDLMSRVSYVMMNPGGEQEMTAAVREAINTLVAQVAREAEYRRRGHRRGRGRRQPDHAPPVPRHRSDRARRGALRARHRLDILLRRGARPAAAIPVPAPTCCPASPAMSAPTARRWCSPRAPHLSDDHWLIVDVGTNAEIVLGNRHAAARLLLADRPGLRGRADLLRPARGTRRHRAAAHRPRERSSRATRSSAATCGRTNRVSPMRVSRPASPASAARASSRCWRRCISRASSARTA